MNAEQIVQDNLDSYNRRDIDGFMASIAEGMQLFTLGESEPALTGREQVRQFYAELFNNSPGLHSSISRRIVIGNKVIDHEQITGRNGASEAVELVLVYEVEASKIFRITVIRP